MGQFEAWYKKVDTSGSGAIQAGPAASFLKKSGLNDNILSRVCLNVLFFHASLSVFLDGGYLYLTSEIVS